MRKGAIEGARRLLLWLICLALVLTAIGLWRSLDAGPRPIWLLEALDVLQLFGPPRIGIVAGHSGSDSGAVCPDGLTEVEVNLKIAVNVVRELQQRGARVDLLEEFDARLRGYRADAFVSIHTDSCEVNLSGFKVASLEGGSEASSRLVDCLWREYEAATALPRHVHTITYDMSRYHAFREIALQTPAAIIETGFLRADRALLTQQPERAAAGIVAGIECFLATR